MARCGLYYGDLCLYLQYVCVMWLYYETREFFKLFTSRSRKNITSRSPFDHIVKDSIMIQFFQLR